MRRDRHPRPRLRAAARPPGRWTPRRFERLIARARRARRWRCGAARRSPMWPASRSRRRRSAGWTSCACGRSSWPIDADLAAGRHGEVRRRARGAARPRTAARAAPRPADAGPVPLRAPGRRAGGLPRRRGSPGDADRRRAGSGAPAPARGDPAPGPRADCPAGRVELPPELDAGTPLVGRDASSTWLREHWHAGPRRRRRGWSLIAGGAGIGKTRLVAELADEVQREGGAVIYARAGVPEERRRRSPAPRRATGRRCSCSTTSTVRDGGPRARRLAAAWPRGRVLVVATARTRTRARRPAPTRCARARAAGRDAAAVAALVRAGARGADVPVERLLAASGGVPARVHEAARSGRARRPRSAARAPPIARRPSAPSCVRPRTSSRGTSSSSRRRASAASAARRRDGARRLPVQGPRVLRRRGRRVLLRARAARRRAGGAAGRRAADGRSSARRAAASPRRCAPGCCRAGARACCPGSEPGRRPCCAPASIRCARSSAGAGGATRSGASSRSISSRSSSPPAATRASARRSSPRWSLRRATRAGARSCSSPSAPTSTAAARPTRSCARLLGANHVARRTDAPRGAAPRDRAARAPGRPARRAGAADALVARRRGRARGAAAAFDVAARAVAAARRPDAAVAAYERAGGVARRRRAAGRGRLRAARSRAQRDVARRILLRLAGEGEGDAVVRRRVPLDGARATATVAGAAVLADDRLVTIGDGDGRGRPRGAAARVAAPARLARGGRRGAAAAPPPPHAAREWESAGRDPASSTAARAWRRRWSGRPSHDAELNAARARASSRPAARARRSARSAACAPALRAGVARAAGARGHRRRRRARPARRGARRRPTAADAQRLGAQALVDDDLDHALLLARRAWRSTTRPQTRGNLLAALLKSPAAIGVLRGDGERMWRPRSAPTGARSPPATPPATCASSTRARAAASPRCGRRRRRWLTGLTYSPDGSRLAVAHDTRARGLVVAVVDVHNWPAFSA